MAETGKACFIVPFRNTEKDDKCADEFIRTAVEYDILKDVYFVIEIPEQRTFLQDVAKKYKSKDFKYLYLKDHTKFFVEGDKNIPTIKKWAGIKAIYKKYDYVAAIDVDCIFVKPFNTYDLLKEVWDQRTCFFKNRTSIMNEVHLINCAYACGLENNRLLIQETQNFTLSCWFNDIPVYKSSTLDDFFDWLDSVNSKNGKTTYQNVKENFCCFDYWIYWFYMICFKGMTSSTYSGYKSVENSIIEDLDSYNNVLCFINMRLPELSPGLSSNILLFDKERVIYYINKFEKETGTHWTSRNYVLTKDDFENSNIYIQFHIDRQQDYLGQRWHLEPKL